MYYIGKQIWHINSLKKRRGFTLAEIVVAVAIIGTLATLTINTYFVDGNSQKSQYVAGLKKVYTELSYATDQIKANNSGTMIGLFNNGGDIITQYCKYLKCSKTCGSNLVVSGGCFNAQSAIKTLNNQSYWDDPTNNYQGFVLANGTLVYLSHNSLNCTWSNAGVANICGGINVDINGFKGPNITGRDIFNFYILQDRISPNAEIGSYSDYNRYCDPASGDSPVGVSCAGRVLKEGKMLY